MRKWSWRNIDEYQAPRETKRSCRHTICAYKDRQAFLLENRMSRAMFGL